QALLQRVVQDAKARDGRSVVLTFEPHPLTILAPQRAPRLILTHKDKMVLLQSYGVDAVIIQPFNSAFANVEAEAFVRGYLVERLKVHKMWVGKDLRFGKGRKGRVEDLIRWGAESGVEVGIVGPVHVEGVRISSSRIRDLIKRGDVHEVQRFLGRYHFASGRVIPGYQRGRQLGFPTANIVTRTGMLPSNGIYATFLEVDRRLWSSVTNIGVNPTFGGGPRTIESYIFDFSGDLYGRSVKLFFVKRIREEKKFPTPEDLVGQMKKDVLGAQEILNQVSIEERAQLAR
ncbi:MAG: bifunctional riboflavin kinase/FAD synthetase, partial [Deltaproteobacteria bacterium]|nr:bifunctional riboflavin kinase/FAD synthetase [Deltaproteobacteria bacterium]